MRTVRLPFLFIGLAFVLLGASDPGYSQEIMPAGRRIDWTYAGIPGGIPNRTIICATIDAGTYGDGVTEASTVINNAKASCPSDQVVYLPAGTYKISSHYITMQSHVVLRGAGPGSTILKAASPLSDRLVGFMGLIASNVPKDPRNVTSAIKDSQTVTLDSTAGISSGDYLLLTQENDASVPVDGTGTSGDCYFCGYDVSGYTGTLGGSYKGTRALGQYVVVDHVVDGYNVAITAPLHWTYNVSLTPKAYHILSTKSIDYAGVEDLTMTQDSALVSYSLDMWGAHNCWVKNVEFYRMWTSSLEMRDSFFNQITGCYFHVEVDDHGDPTNHYGSNFGYGIDSTMYSSNNLIDNNIAYTTDGGGIEMHGGSSGNVIAYNYIANQFLRDITWLASGPDANHGAHPKMNLYEGNIGPAFQGDFVWGSSSHITMFRSRATGYKDESTTVNRSAVRPVYKNKYYNFVGNILGTSGKEGMYEAIPSCSDGKCTCPYNPSTQSAIYVLGCDVGGSGNDPSVASSTLRHGNYDYYSNSTIWDPKIADHTLRSSLYLSQKPDWWCQETPWPPIGPDVAGMVNPIPAERRFEGLPCTPVNKPTTPRSLRIIP